LNLPHLHLLLNHWPIIGTFIGLGLLAIALIARSTDVKQGSYAVFALMAVATIPVYLSGNAAAEKIKKMPEVSMMLIDTHEGAALFAFAALELTGLLALAGLWQFSRSKETSKDSSAITMGVLVLALASAGLVAVAGNSGGDIRHSEILEKGEAASSIAAAGASLLLSIRYFVIDYSRWVWPILEALHFVGLILLIGTVCLLNLRLLGFYKALPVGPIQKFLPWGIAGLIINVITGFMFFIGMPFFYTDNWIFQFKIAALVLAAAELLIYCTAAFRHWDWIGPEDNAPGLAKLVAASSIVLWVAVVVLGRYIPLGAPN
jgi:hypothetical protein